MTKPYTTIRRFPFELIGISLDRNYQEVMNLLFVSPGLYLNIYLIYLNTYSEEILQFWETKYCRRAWHVIPAQEMKRPENKFLVGVTETKKLHFHTRVRK